MTGIQRHLSVLVIVLALQAPAGCLAQEEIAFACGTKIWIVDTSSSHVRLVTDLPDHDRPICWSPDGSRILFWKHGEIGWNFWTIRADGTDPQQLTRTDGGGYRSGAWSRDGKLIACMRDDPEGLYVMNPDGTGERRLTAFGYREGVPSWSPAGDHLLIYSQGAEGPNGRRPGLYVANSGANGESEPRFLVSGWQGSWSPVNNEIVCLTRTKDHTNISRVDVETGSIQSPGSYPESVDSPAWSPDGREIAFLRHSGEREVDVCVLARDGGEPRVLTTALRVNHPSLQWSPEGQSIAYLSWHEDEPSLFVISSQGGEPKYLAGGMYEFAWRPTTGRIRQQPPENPGPAVSVEGRDVEQDVEREVREFLARLTVRLKQGGPLAWGEFIWNDPSFYLANNGERKTDGYDGTMKHLSEIKDALKDIELELADLRIQVLSKTAVGVSARYEESYTMADNTTEHISGYFTATLVFIDGEWKLANMHWSAATGTETGDPGN